MSRLLELLNNVSTFNYYTGKGNFNQNKLPFGADRANGGSSKEPYIKKPLYKRDALGVTDMITHTATDVLRVTKFLKDVPKGPLFIAKQVGLQMTNPRMQSLAPTPTDKATKGQGFIKNIANLVANGANGIKNLVGSNRVWTPVNFLAQIAGSGVGKSIPRHGFSLSVPEKDKNWYIVDKIEKSSGGQDNRIISYLKRFSDASEVVPQEGSQRLMYSYPGGPNSYLGLGSTSIYSYYSTFAASDVKLMDTVAKLNGFRPIAPSTLVNSSQEDLAILRETDFRAYKVGTDAVYKKEVSQKKIRISDYSKYNTSKRIGVINTNNKSFQEVLHDGVNMIAPYYSDGPEPVKGTKDINDEPVTKEGIRDIIKFIIKILDNDKVGYGTYLVFRAFINSMNDSMDADWKQVRYTGRGESFYNYEGFTSGFSVSFTVVAFSKEEMKPLYQKLNYLKSSLAPDYKNNRMRGNLAELTVGDYLKYQPGIINSINITPPENVSWEIAMNEVDNEAGDLDKDMHELPQMLKVDLGFTPIYNFLPRKSASSPFIGIDSNNVNSAQDWTTGRNDKLK